MSDLMFRIVREDQILRTRSTLRDYLRMLQRILKDSPYRLSEIGPIQCYLMRGIYADVVGGQFHVFFEGGIERILLGIVTKKRLFFEEIYAAYNRITF